MNIIKIKNINIFSFDLPLKKAFVLKNTSFDSRRGILVELETNQGIKYYGESSPLVYFNQENYSDCLYQISEIRKIMLDNPEGFYIEIPEENKYFMEDFGIFFIQNFLEKIKKNGRADNPENIFPSVRYCFEMLYFCIFIKNPDFARYYNVSSDSFIPLCRLIPDISRIDYGVLEEEIRRNEYNTIKIKIGRQKPESEISAIRRIIDIIENINRKDVLIRLDSNMSLSESCILQMLENINKSYIDFIEDPVENISSYQDIYEKTGVTIAADETIKKFIDFKKMSFKNNAGKFIKALVIKPQSIGGITDSFRLFKMAQHAKIKTVISNIFETSISVSALCIFIYLINNQKIAAGLDTLDIFLKDPGIVKIKSDSARISVCRAYENLYKADYSVLRKLH